MTDNEIIKALECCLKGCNAEGCDDCPLYEKVEDCEIEIPIIALDLINRQKAKISELQSEATILTQANEHLQELCKEERAKVSATKQKLIEAFTKLKFAKSEAIREFAERLKAKSFIRENGFEANEDRFRAFVVVCEIDNLVKEMTEESNDQQKT